MHSKKIDFICFICITILLSPDIQVSLAQIKPDRRIGQENSRVTTKGTIDEITGGSRRGNNLFHSFQEFSIKNGRKAKFQPDSNIANIFSRITGKNPSRIDGVLGVMGNANLFFLNPNGIIFGKNAQLEVRGSFIATTGDSFLFSDGSEFSATNPQAPPLLTVEAPQPIGIRFEGQSGEISYLVKNPDLTPLPLEGEQTFGLIGGKININGGVIIAPEVNIEIGSVTGNNTVNLTPQKSGWSVSYHGVKEFGGVDILGGVNIDTSGAGAGGIQIYGKNINLQDNTEFYSETTGEKNGRDINLIASDSISLSNQSAIYSLSSGTGNGVEIILIAGDSIKISNGSTVQTQIFSQGNAGNLTIKSGNLVELNKDKNYQYNTTINSFVEADSAGKGGTITIETKKLKLLNLDTDLKASNYSKVDATPGNIIIKSTDSVTLTDGSSINNSVQPDSTSNGGNISLETNKLEISQGSQISVETFGDGYAGNLSIKAQDSVQVTGKIIDVDFEEKPFTKFSSINTEVLNNSETRVIGKGGNVTIETKKLMVSDSGEIFSVTTSVGDGGNLLIKALESLTVDKGRISATTSQRNALGNAGSLTIETPKLVVTQGGDIATSTASRGKGGDLYIRATDSVALTGDSRIGSQVDKLATGDAGVVIIETKILSMDGLSQLSTSTLGEGNGGDLTIKAKNSVRLINDTVNTTYPTSVSSTVEDNATGDAGNITIETQNLNLDFGAQVLSDTRGVGNAGNINITAKQIEIQGTAPANLDTPSGLFAKVAQTGEGNGGEIKVNTDNLNIQDSGAIRVDSLGEGKAGTINLVGNQVTLDAQAKISGEIGGVNAGEGGDIEIRAQDYVLLRRQSEISTSAVATNNQDSKGNGGNITITTPALVAFPLETNRIQSNAFTGTGGKIKINADNVLGIFERNRPYDDNYSDITTFSQSGIQGVVDINTLNLNPLLNLYAAPQSLKNVSFVQLCESDKPEESLIFGYIGRGGFALDPTEVFSSTGVVAPWLELKKPNQFDSSKGLNSGPLAVESQVKFYSFACEPK